MRDDDEFLCIIIASMVLMVVFGGIITAINIFTSPVDAGETFIAYRAVIYEREIQSTDSESVLTTGCTISDGVDKAKLVRKGVLYLHKKDALKSMENWEKGSCRAPGKWKARISSERGNDRDRNISCWEILYRRLSFFWSRSC